eukprot:710307-Pelagomonas_calceolata.AAC.1
MGTSINDDWLSSGLPQSCTHLLRAQRTARQHGMSLTQAGWVHAGVLCQGSGFLSFLVEPSLQRGSIVHGSSSDFDEDSM